MFLLLVSRALDNALNFFLLFLLFPFFPSFAPFFALSKPWPSWVMLYYLTLTKRWCLLLLVHVGVKNWRWERHQVCPQHWHLKAGSHLGLFPRLVGQQHRGGFGRLRASHPRSCPGVCSCFGTHWQSGRLKVLPRGNFLFGKSCTFHLSLPGLFTPWIKHGINDELVLQSSLKPTEHEALCSC